MGEPQPGDYPDPINVRTANVLLKATQIGSSGGYVRFNSSGTPAWEIINTTLITTQGVIQGAGFIQLAQDIDSTGIADAVANASGFGPGSWFYGLANGIINPNDFVVLDRTGTQFGFKNTRDLTGAATGAAVATNVITITTDNPHHLKVGDAVVTTGFTPAAFNASLIVASITDEDTFTAALTTGDATSTVFGRVEIPVTGEFAHAQYVKQSGETFEAGAVLNDICVFSMLKGGQPTT